MENQIRQKEGRTMILMSNNQWKCDHNNDTWRAMGEDCSAECRSIGLARAYQEIVPDILGLQEVSMRMTDLVLAQLRSFETEAGEKVHYDLITGGDTPILYRDDKLLLIESGFFRYSEEFPGHEGCYNNDGTKSYAWGVFEEKATGKKIALMSTHLWWKSNDPSVWHYQPYSDEAREYQMRIAAARMEEIMEKYGCPGVIMGDLNAVMNSLCLKAAYELGWKEAHDVTEGECDQTRGHHPCGPEGFVRNEPGTFDQAIDHILIRNAEGMKVRSYLRLTHEWYDKVSDHYPVYIDVEL